MSGNCFLKQEASSESIANVASFCSDCYETIVVEQVIFYDMQNYCYLCEACQEKLEETLDLNCEPIDENRTSLFN